ncbi:TPA: cadmium-translocating P-type ATPase [Streptococcus agalactiae]|nr:cadmium-translocating P-type ATPase [Streptococcus agalactiae]HEN3089756.1 cadmium-translocating P-type ATPase [Streptococcus agalactiae]
MNRLNINMKLYIIGIIIFFLAMLFPFSKLITNLLLILATIISGYHVMWEGLIETITNTRRKKIFYPNTHILMTLAAIGAILLGDSKEAALLILIFSGAHFLEEYIEDRNQKEITTLLKMNPTEARRLGRDGKLELVPVNELKIGDHLQVLNGDQIPTDGVIIEGIASINESSINGESIPREKSQGDIVFGSTLNGDKSFIMEVTKNSEDTVFSKIIQLVEKSQNNLSPTESFIKKMEPVYVTAVLLIFILLIVILPTVFKWTLMKAFAKGLVFMVSASPCALAVSAIPSTVAGIANLAKKGILFKGGSYLSIMADLKAISFDKTGTLTLGKPEVVSYKFSPETIAEEDLISVILSMEHQSNHPLARAIVNYFEKGLTSKINLNVENKIGEGLTAFYENNKIQIAKPSFFSKVEEKWLIEKEQEEKKGATVIFIAINDSVIGYIAIQDKPQESAIDLISNLTRHNIKSIMITGDSEKTGKAIANQIGIDKVIANVLPEEKANHINSLKNKYGLVGMVGDGVNDAPALANADVGIAMGEGSDVAIETADVVIMKNDLTNLGKAIHISLLLKKNIKQNVTISLTVVLILVTLTFGGNLNIVQSVALHEGSTLIVLLNSMRLLTK